MSVLAGSLWKHRVSAKVGRVVVVRGDTVVLDFRGDTVTMSAADLSRDFTPTDNANK